jgi:aminomethyltransferase
MYSIAPVNTEAPLKKTPLYEEHARIGAKLVGFGGWNMPVQYTGIIEEHLAVRHAVGLFDISHMGQFIVTGPNAKSWLNRMLANNLDRIEAGQCQYTFLLNEKGGVIDDLIAYRTTSEEYFLVVNASMIDEDFAWMQSHLIDGVELKNWSDDFAGLAVQGPKAAQLFQLFFEGKETPPGRNEIKRIENGAIRYYIANTGYTGEEGFEFFFPATHAVAVWNNILSKGAELGIKPCGLGARDTLRLEMCYPLNGSDLAPDRTPIEAGLAFFIDLQKPGFIGREALLKQKEAGIQQRLVPFRMKDKSPPPRPHYAIYKGENKIGEICSGSLSPSLNTGIGMAYLPVELAQAGAEIEIDIRGRRFTAVIGKKPLLRKVGQGA